MIFNLMSKSRYAIVIFSVISSSSFSSGMSPLSSSSSSVSNVYVIPSDRTTVWAPGLSYSTTRVTTGEPETLPPFADGGQIDGTKPGIPHYTNVFATVTAAEGSSAVRAALQDAAAAASPTNPLVVQLGAGVFNISGRRGSQWEIGSYVVLRGTTDSSGNLLTAVKRTDTVTNEQFGNIYVGAYGGEKFDETRGHILTTVGDAIKGTTSVTVTPNPTTAGFGVGDLVHISELDWASGDLTRRMDRVWLQQDVPAWCRPDRHVSQLLEVASIDGNTLSFSTPFHLTYRASHAAEIVRQDSTHPPVRWAGVEDLYVEAGGGGYGYGGNIVLNAAMYSWAKHIESSLSLGGAVVFDGSFRSELRDSLLHHAYHNYPGGGEYGLSVETGSSDNLIENNIIWSFGKGMVFHSSGGGNVVGYNYVTDVYNLNDPTYLEGALQASHEATPHDELFEGNQAANFQSDNTHGNSFNIVTFRNHLEGMNRTSISDWMVSQGKPSLPYLTRKGHSKDDAPTVWKDLNPSMRAGLRSPYSIAAHTHHMTAVGNVLGFEGQPMNVPQAPQTEAHYEQAPPDDAWDGSIAWVWMIGSGSDGDNHGSDPDPLTVSTQLRHMNYSYALGGVPAQLQVNGKDNKNLPASLYLPAKPAFMGTNPWPWVTPEDAIKLHVLPARKRFDLRMPMIIE